MSDSQPKITVYSTTWCAYCKPAKEYLKKLGLKFKEIDIDKDRQAAQYLYVKTGYAVVPVIQIDDRFVLGFNRQALDEILQKS